MSGLPLSTRHRLKQLPQTSAVWEGDRRCFNEDEFASLPLRDNREGDCILWVDGSQGNVRAMDVVSPEVGPEAMVRTLLQAMEFPHSSPPGRPQKIVVRDLQVQFFLRGALQDLDIKVECQTELPLIDEIFRGLADLAALPSPSLSSEVEDLLDQKAFAIWHDAPWDYLEDHQVIAITLNQWDIDTLYCSVMGMLGMEYGILLYRSLDSLRQFCSRAGQDHSPDQMQEVFLSQDCLFLTFGSVDEDEDDQPDLTELPINQIEPRFGSIHPLEGLHPLLHDDQAAVLIVALESLHRFLRQHSSLQTSFTALQSRYRIPTPLAGFKPLSIQVSTLPEVAAELAEVMEKQSEEDDDGFTLREDLVPDKAQLGLGMLPWSYIEHLGHIGQLRQPDRGDVLSEGDGFPVAFVQTSRPKAKQLIQELEAAGGIQSICFSQGMDPLQRIRYDLEIVQTGNGELHLFGEFLQEDPVHAAARKLWDQRCRKTGGFCGLAIAMGVTSASQGLQLRHILAVFQVKATVPEDLGLGPLLRMSAESEMF